ncbi:MAG: deoxyribonuclease IV [Bacteroidales bacterium]|nr:deoxyribonuclease IV [Bacteroidales bacterium]
MFTIGCHLSASKGYLHMGKEALSIGASTFQYFSRNPRGGAARPVDPEDCAALRAWMADHAMPVILAHAPYTLNACSADPALREFAENVMREDLRTMEYLPGNLYNFHPGSHVGQGVETAVEQISGLLNRVLWPEQQTTVLLEAMSGKGSEVGRTFEELRAIIDRVSLQEKMGVCLDTCHVYAAGYDVVNHLNEVLATFDRVIGLSRLKAIHLNDSMTPFDSHKDRHEKIGAGTLGADAIRRIINHPLLRDLPFFLETPNELDGYAAEIVLLKSWRED